MFVNLCVCVCVCEHVEGHTLVEAVLHLGVLGVDPAEHFTNVALQPEQHRSLLPQRVTTPHVERNQLSQSRGLTERDSERKKERKKDRQIAVEKGRGERKRKGGRLIKIREREERQR